MKALNTVLKVLTALAAVAGAIYVIATYGDRIVDWAKKLLASCPCKCCCEAAEDAPAAEEAPVEEVPATEEAPAEEPADEPAEEPAAEPAAENEPVAEEADFEG